MKMLTLRCLLAALCMLSLSALLSAKDAAASKLKLADGKSVPIVTVAALNEDPAAHEGWIALDGQVGEVWADKGRFMLVDYGAGHCTDENCAGCEADQKTAIRFDKAKLKGALPKTEDKVYAIVVCKATETGGYTLDLHEVRAGEKTLLTIKH